MWNDLPYMVRQMSTLDDPETRRSFLATIKAVIEPGGQGINATERLHLAEGLPTMVVWGEDDRIIPNTHGSAASELVPGCRFELILLFDPALVLGHAQRVRSVTTGGARTVGDGPLGAGRPTPVRRGRS